MTKVFKSAIGLKQKTKKAVVDTMPRYGTVAASNGQMVQLIMDGDAEPGGFYPSSIYPVAVGTRGVVQPVQGGAKIFTPLGLHILPQYKLLEASFTFSTAGTYRIGNLGDGGDPMDKLGGLTFRGLDPSRPYTVDGTVSIRTGGTTARTFHLLFIATGAIEMPSSFGIYQTEDTSNAMSTFSALSPPVYPTSGGIIYVNPGVQTSTGVVTGTRSTIKASVF